MHCTPAGGQRELAAPHRLLGHAAGLHQPHRHRWAAACCVCPVCTVMEIVQYVTCYLQLRISAAVPRGETEIICCPSSRPRNTETQCQTCSSSKYQDDIQWKQIFVLQMYTLSMYIYKYLFFSFLRNTQVFHLLIWSIKTKKMKMLLIIWVTKANKIFVKRFTYPRYIFN